MPEVACVASATHVLVALAVWVTPASSYEAEMVSVPGLPLFVYVKAAVPLTPVVPVPVCPLSGPSVTENATDLPASALPPSVMAATTVCWVPTGFDAVAGERSNVIA